MRGSAVAAGASSANEATLPGRRTLTPEVGVGAERFFFLILQVGGDDNLDVHEEITPSSPLEMRDTLLSQSVHRFWLRPPRDLETLMLSVEQRNLDVSTEGRFGVADLDAMVQVIANTLEPRFVGDSSRQASAFSSAAAQSPSWRNPTASSWFGCA